GGVKGFFGAGSLDAASSPTSALSLIGGPAGGAVIADVYNQEYRNAQRAGLDEVDSEIWAVSQAAPELISLIPAGKLLERLPVVRGAMGRLRRMAADVRPGLADRVTKPNWNAAINIGAAAVGEGIEEEVADSLQDITAAAV